MAEIIVSPHIQTALESLRQRLDELCTLADNLGQQHFDFVMAENKRRTWEEKSILYVTPRLRDNTLTVTWYEVHWYGSKELKTRRMTKKVIVKPKAKYGYTMETLLKRAQSWEADMVSDVELALIPIRREASFIAKALGQLNYIAARKK